MRSVSPKRSSKRPGPRPRGLVKKTIVMSKARDAAIRRAVAEGRAASASGYIERALEAFATLESYDDFLSEWRREVGPPTAEERAWANAAVAHAKSGRERKTG